MSERDVEKPSVTPSRPSGVRTVLRYTGIPTSWLDKRPKLPSRNWLIFIGVTSSITGYYIYDRRQCKQIRQEYIDKVKGLAELPSSPLDKPRKVTVYGSKWPGDEDYDQSLRYFRKYVKPILVAAAVDYEMVGSKRLGELSGRIADDIRRRRRMDLGIDKESELSKALPTYEPLPQARQRELEGGIVVVGRPTWKEFLHGLHRGWTEDLQKVDEEEVLARELEVDGVFDEPEEPGIEAESPAGTRPRSSIHQMPSLYSPIQLPNQPNPQQQTGPSSQALKVLPPSEIPPLPPILLVPFTNYIGFTQIPLMLWGFFNQRHKVRSGSEAAYNLIMRNTRPILPPSHLFRDSETESRTSLMQGKGDLEFDRQADAYIKKSLNDIPQDINKGRRQYYEELPKRLETARALARGIREPTPEELSNPPPTEVELRQERVNKERRWRNDLAGWTIVKPSSPAAWDDRFCRAIRFFTAPASEHTSND